MNLEEFIKCVLAMTESKEVEFEVCLDNGGYVITESGTKVKFKVKQKKKVK